MFYPDTTLFRILRLPARMQARAFVVTADDAETAERMVSLMHGNWPAVPIHARARSIDHAARLLELGASDVVPEALEGSLQLAGRLLGEVGLPDEAVDQRLAVAREMVRARLRAEPRSPAPTTPPEGV